MNRQSSVGALTRFLLFSLLPLCLEVGNKADGGGGREGRGVRARKREEKEGRRWWCEKEEEDAHRQRFHRIRRQTDKDPDAMRRVAE